MKKAESFFLFVLLRPHPIFRFASKRTNKTNFSASVLLQIFILLPFYFNIFVFCISIIQYLRTVWWIPLVCTTVLLKILGLASLKLKLQIYICFDFQTGLIFCFIFFLFTLFCFVLVHLFLFCFRFWLFHFHVKQVKKIIVFHFKAKPFYFHFAHFSPYTTRMVTCLQKWQFWNRVK